MSNASWREEEKRTAYFARMANALERIADALEKDQSVSMATPLKQGLAGSKAIDKGDGSGRTDGGDGYH